MRHQFAKRCIILHYINKLSLKGIAIYHIYKVEYGVTMNYWFSARNYHLTTYTYTYLSLKELNLDQYHGSQSRKIKIICIPNVNNSLSNLGLTHKPRLELHQLKLVFSPVTVEGQSIIVLVYANYLRCQCVLSRFDGEV